MITFKQKFYSILNDQVHNEGSFNKRDRLAAASRGAPKRP